MKLLDVFCGEGGAGVGYANVGFTVTGIDNNGARLKRYPLPYYKGDALEYLADLDFTDQFDAIHASPPCTGYTRGTAAIPDRLEKYDRLIPIVRELLIATRKPYIIENVEDAKPELRNPIRLCWTEFRVPGCVIDTDGTALQMFRHRLFESGGGLELRVATGCHHEREMQVAGAYGGARRDKHEARHVRKGGYVPPSLNVLQELLQTPWMSETGCFLSIPPAYTQFLGLQVMNHLKKEAA